MSATDPIIEDGRVCGVRLLTGEEVLANLTVLSEGVCGAVTRKVFQSKGFQADDRSDCYALGIKIVVEAPDDLSDGVVLSLVG
jgi:flavin-dependent dehydrogenase